MSEITERYIKEAVSKSEAALTLEHAVKVVVGGYMSMERAAEVFGVPLEQLQEKLANR